MRGSTRFGVRHTGHYLLILGYFPIYFLICKVGVIIMPTAQMLVRQMKQNNALKAQSMVSGKAAGRSQGIPPSPTHRSSHALRHPEPKEPLPDTAWGSSSRPTQLTLILQPGFCKRWPCFPVKCSLSWGYFPGVGSAKLRVQNGGVRQGQPPDLGTSHQGSPHWAWRQGQRQGYGFALHVSSTWQSSVTFHCKSSSK